MDSLRGRTHLLPDHFPRSQPAQPESLASCEHSWFTLCQGDVLKLTPSLRLPPPPTAFWVHPVSLWSSSLPALANVLFVVLVLLSRRKLPVNSFDMQYTSRRNEMRFCPNCFPWRMASLGCYFRITIILGIFFMKSLHSKCADLYIACVFS